MITNMTLIDSMALFLIGITVYLLTKEVLELKRKVEKLERKG